MFFCTVTWQVTFYAWNNVTVWLELMTLQSNLDYPDFFSGPVFFMNIDSFNLK